MDTTTRQAPLAYNLKSCKFTAPLRKATGCCDTGAAIIMQVYRYGELSFSRDSKYYSARRYHSPLSKYLAVTRAMDRLTAQGLVLQDRRKPGLQSKGLRSSVAATDELFDMVTALTNGEAVAPCEPRELIIMRDRQKNLSDYRDSRNTNTMRNRLKDHGEAVKTSGITGCELGPMVRIFNEAWNRGGRAYALWQNVPKKERERFMQNGEPMVELDYRAIHPSILYSERGLSVPDDCYDVAGFARGDLKLAMLILINAGTLRSATMALASELENGARDAQERPLLTCSEDIPAHRYTEARKLIEAVKGHHKPIQDAFHSGAGTRLQAIDAAIAESVWWTMYQRGVVVLPVHDSFIVQASHANELEQVMTDAAVKVVGIAIKVTR